MRGKRILAWICALCVCVSLTGCATGINMEGMSDEELKALEAAAREKLEERREANLDAMSDEELEALMAEAQERLKPSLGEMSFDELIALKDEAEKRLGPPPEVTPSEDVLVLEGSVDGEPVPKYIGKEDIPEGIWYVNPMPRSHALISLSEIVDGKDKNRINIFLDGRTNRDIPSDMEMTITEKSVIRVWFEPVVLCRSKSEERKTTFDGSAVLTDRHLDTMNKVQLETLYRDIHTILYANALSWVDKKWTTDETVKMEKGCWHVGKDVPAGFWTIRPARNTVAFDLLEHRLKTGDEEATSYNYIGVFFADASDESGKPGRKVLLMPNTWIRLYGPGIFSRE